MNCQKSNLSMKNKQKTPFARTFLGPTQILCFDVEHSPLPISCLRSLFRTVAVLALVPLFLPSRRELQSGCPSLGEIRHDDKVSLSLPYPDPLSLQMSFMSFFSSWCVIHHLWIFSFKELTFYILKKLNHLINLSPLFMVSVPTPPHLFSIPFGVSDIFLAGTFFATAPS